MKTIQVPLQQLDSELPMPRYAHDGDAGADLVTSEDFTLTPGERRMVPTGVAVAIPMGWVGLVHPRSGLASRHGISMVNAPGTVDSGYRGELKVLLINTDPSQTVSFSRGDRIAQIVFQEVARAVFSPVETLPDTARGTGGFGSSGLSSTPDHYAQQL
ncbi:dUTP diphosphatase [Nesterenkonia salmonea]|uniref:Deoxyuridine 5'-triphosphate nucleotidohydrolase n=1 Tax=Nesterenkonia salmonea TaxID=1804987 RepID=A0A5R9BDH5_9MICC|nr:dUTP diphosphatase [Nesterenkonia salmonea]TLP97962.1 dUTP diphosphatase [Nesterenkonia salmonea]